MVSISFRSSSTFCCSLFNTLCLVSVDLSLQDPLQKLLKLLLTFILIQPAVQKFCHVCLLCEKSGTPASIIKILQENPGKLIFYIGMRLMIQCKEIIFEGFPGTDFGHIRVMIGVIAYRMSLCQHPFHQIRAGFQIMPHHKECGWGIVFFQGVQNRGRISIFKATVKGQINSFFFRFFYIIGVVFPENSRRDISGGLCSRLAEAQTPACGGSGGRIPLRQAGACNHHLQRRNFSLYAGVYKSPDGKRI